MLQIADRKFQSRLFLGTGKFGSAEQMADAVRAARSEMVTVALKRITLDVFQEELPEDRMLAALKSPGVHILPNTSGARNAEEAVLAARLAREALETNWVKLEIHPDPRYLMPDPVETLKATAILAGEGFVVLPYIHADPVLCKRLEEAGTAAVMPLGAPIGTNKGLKTVDFLEIIIEQSRVPVIIDAGLGSPSQAAQAMEMGADAVLVNTGIAAAGDPVAMAEAFRLAVTAGRAAYEAGLAGIVRYGMASSPLTTFLD